MSRYKQMLQTASDLLKYVPNQLVDEHDNPTTEILKVGSESKADKIQLKELDIHPDELKEQGVKFKPKHAYIRVVTCGDGKFYGPNLKADYFHESPQNVEIPYPCEEQFKTVDIGPGLMQRHKTFRDKAKVFRNHNYKVSPSGNIVWERYHNPMHRGEALLELPLSLWEDDIQKYHQGHPLYWSQGSKVPYEVCSVCGFHFHAQKPRRCEHMRKMPLGFHKGHQVFVYNPMPSFFEMSEVGQTPAAKISYALKKVASEGVLGDVHGHAQEMCLPRTEISLHTALKDKNAKEAALRKLTACEDQMSSFPVESDLAAIQSFKLLPEQISRIQTCLKGMEWCELLPALKKLHCILPPNVFYSILNPTESGDLPDVSEFKDALNCVYQKVTQNGDYDDVLEDSTYSSQLYHPQPAATSLLKSIERLLSIKPEMAAVRAQSLPKPQMKIRVIKTSSETSPLADLMAREYVKYQTEMLCENPDWNEKLMVASTME